MSQQRRILIYGQQREAIDLDLMAQIVIMLGRQLAAETMQDGSMPPDDFVGESLPPAEAQK
jgi:hypothetical protein